MATVFDALEKPVLAMLAREYLLCGHLIDRSGMPQVVGAHGMDGMREIAIDEWMGASPIYTRRIRRLLGFEGDDVETIFKGMQVDIGAPPQFMDFRYQVNDAKDGEFWLDCCGALMDVEGLGDDYVTTVCHHIEDPTFDATAAATNPRARMRPIHRPPRVPADRQPHCHWTVRIDDDADPLPEPEAARRIAQTRAATIEMPEPEGPDDDGRTDYTGPLENDLDPAAFSRQTLIALLNEICLQGHLLTLSFADAVERRWGAEEAGDILRRQFVGIAGVAASRVHAALGLGTSLEDIATVLEYHPAFHPRSYVDVRISRDGSPGIVLHDGPAVGDRPGRSWAELLADGFTAPLDAMVQAVDPRASCVEVDAPAGALRAWEVGVGAEPAPVAGEVRLTRFSTGAGFTFEERTPVRIRRRRG